MNVTRIEFSMLFSRNLTKQAPQSPVKVSKQEFHVSRSLLLVGAVFLLFIYGRVVSFTRSAYIRFHSVLINSCVRYKQESGVLILYLKHWKSSIFIEITIFFSNSGMPQGSRLHQILAPWSISLVLLCSGGHVICYSNLVKHLGPAVQQWRLSG